MNLAHEIQAARKQIDTILEQLARKVASAEPVQTPSRRVAPEVEHYESIYPLALDGAVFKGTKPTALLFSDTERIEVYTWKMVFCELLKRLNKDPEKHVELMNLRGKIAGRDRLLLSRDTTGMRSPHKVANNLYVETHYDTETLLRILTTRILDAVNYDYSGIFVAVRNKP